MATDTWERVKDSLGDEIPRGFGDSACATIHKLSIEEILFVCLRERGREQVRRGKAHDTTHLA
jgi:hypothetical protein